MTSDPSQASGKAGVLSIAAVVIASAGAAALATYGIVQELVPCIAAGFGSLAVVIGTAPAALRPRVSSGATADKMSELAAAVRRLGELQALSDDARRVLNRDRERELLREAIERDIATRDWNAGLVLVKELADRFGYREDAEQFRKRIESAQAETIERDIADATTELDKLIVNRRWDDARAEANRIRRLFPERARTKNLLDRVEHARRRVRSDVEARFLDAAQSERTDEAMQLLKELDSYLTPEEAEQYTEVARGVIGKARDNLGAQFKVALRDQQHATAVELGERIIREFPNSRMADEVREHIDAIRSRSAAAGS